jgi:hypothetical protein
VNLEPRGQEERLSLGHSRSALAPPRYGGAFSCGRGGSAGGRGGLGYGGGFGLVAISPTLSSKRSGKYLAIGAHHPATAIIACNTCYGWIGGQNEDDENGKQHRHASLTAVCCSLRFKVGCICTSTLVMPNPRFGLPGPRFGG